MGPDGKPADHAAENVPYKPKHFLKIASEDLDPGDFVMVAGYPGRTSRLKTGDEVEDAVSWSLPRKIARSEQYLAVLEQAIGTDDTLRIKANPQVRGLANGLTNAKGMLDGLGKPTGEDFKNAKAALFTKAAHEIVELVTACGGLEVRSVPAAV